MYLGNCNVKTIKCYITTLSIYRTFKNYKILLNGTKIPKEGKNFKIKISLKEIIHKIMRNKTDYEFIIANLGINK